MTSLIPVRYKDKTQLISQRCAVNSLNHFLLSQCSETSLCFPPILITLTNVNFPDDIKNNLWKNVFFSEVIMKRMTNDEQPNDPNVDNGLIIDDFFFPVTYLSATDSKLARQTNYFFVSKHKNKR